MAMVSSPSTAQAHDVARSFEAPLLYVNDKCHECVVRLASRDAVPLISITASPTPLTAHS